jgi:hypothetical protein
VGACGCEWPLLEPACNRAAQKLLASPSHTHIGDACCVQGADQAGKGWESWMRAAQFRWHRTKDATNEGWEAAKDSARRCVIVFTFAAVL